MNKILYILLAASTAFLSSCGNCDGVDNIRFVDGISLITSDDSAAYYDSKPGDTFALFFSIIDKLGSRKGTRDCHHKDLVESFENAWRTDLFEFSCSEVLIDGGDTLMPHANLLQTRICRHSLKLDPAGTGRIDNQSRQIILSGFKKPVLNKTHTFFIKGVTNNNKTFTDSCHIYIH